MPETMKEKDCSKEMGKGNEKQLNEQIVWERGGSPDLARWRLKHRSLKNAAGCCRPGGVRVKKVLQRGRKDAKSKWEESLQQGSRDRNHRDHRRTCKDL